MSTTPILDITGKPAMSVATDAKKAHDPEELKRERIRLNNLLRDACEAYAKDRMPIPNAPVIIDPDDEVLRTHHGEKWRELAKVMNASSFPHPVDEEAMYKQIDAMLKEERQQSDAQKPLAQVTDLDQYDLPALDRTADGVLRINTRVAVCVSDHGQTLVWLRGKNESNDEWCSGWLPKPTRYFVVDALDYTLGELMRLIAATRVQKIARLTPEQMEACKTPAKKTLFR